MLDYPLRLPPAHIRRALNDENLDTVKRHLDNAENAQELVGRAWRIFLHLNNPPFVPVSPGSFGEGALDLAIESIRERAPGNEWINATRQIFIAAAHHSHPEMLDWADRFCRSRVDGGAGALIIQEGSTAHETYVQYAIQSDRIEILDWFLQRGARPNGTEAWTSALSQTRLDFLLRLQEAGDAFYCPGGRPSGASWLHAWVAGAHIDLVRAKSGEAPLLKPHPTLEFLMNLGADPNIRDGFGETAQRYALTIGSPEMAKMIEEAVDRRAAHKCATQLGEQTPAVQAASKGVRL